MKRRTKTRALEPASVDGAAASIAEILKGFDPKDPSTIALVEEAVEKSQKLMYLQMNRVQEDFVRIKNKQGRMPRTRIFEAGNQSGKTVIGVAEDIAHAMGFRVWLKKDDPDFRIRIKVPNSGLVGCEVAGQNLIQRLEPLFNELIPAHCEAEPTRYSDGSLKSIYLRYDYFGNKCGSTIHFRSYVQSADSFEGVLSDWLHWDEPPPQAILNAALRGGMATNAPRWFTMTPLKEPYIYDLFSINAFNNNGDDPEIAIFRCSTWENCQDWCRDCNVTVARNHASRFPPGGIRPVDRCPSCKKIMGFMPRAGIENYLKTITDEDEREAREEGKWKHLSGSIYKTFSKETHTYPDFTIPRDWMRIEMVDPHDAKPTRGLFAAVSPEEIFVNGRPANRIYFYAYLLADGNIDAIARSVKIKRAEHDYREPAMVIIDAKFGTKTVRTMEEETSWENELDKAGIKHITLSHSAPGDVAIGHKIVKQYLQTHYSKTQNREFPGMMFAKQGCSGVRSPIQDMSNYRWKEGSDKPELDYKDFPDCVRYAAMEQPVYRMPLPDDYIPVAAPVESYNPLTYGLAMRGMR